MENQFKTWVDENGPVKAAKLINEHEEAAGNPPIRYQYIQNWIKSQAIPPKRIVSVHRASGIPLEELAPSIFGAVA